MIEVVQPGVFTLVQDQGRWGAHAHGIGPAGAADWFSARLANHLVGNPADAALLECAIVGPRLRIMRDAWIAVAGAPCDISITSDAAEPVRFTAGTPTSLRAWSVPAGSTVAIGAMQRGCRAYLAIDGGLAIEPLLGSRSALRRAGIAGPRGGPLIRGAQLGLCATSRANTPPRPRWSTGEGVLLPVAAGSPVDGSRWREFCAILEHLVPPDATTLRMMPAPVVDTLSADAVTALWHTTWRVSSRSDRMGVRLVGDGVALAADTRSSEPVVTGTVQLPPDGQPIILLNDRQTTGGYPVLGEICTADLPRLAQLGPNATVTLQPITLKAARTELARLDDVLTWVIAP